jgi:hypothetical protein
VKRFDRHVYFVDKRFYVLVDDVELNESATLTWNFHGVKDAVISAAGPATITNKEARVEIFATSPVKLAVASKTDHVLPRLEWTTEAKVKEARVAWVLAPSRTSEKVAMPTVELHADFVVVNEGARQFRLPIVRRRLPQKTSMTLIQRD